MTNVLYLDAKLAQKFQIINSTLQWNHLFIQLNIIGLRSVYYQHFKR